MSQPDPTTAKGMPRGVAAGIMLLLSLQIGLSYLQGSLLHRQQEEIQGIRADLQDLVEVLEEAQGATGPAERGAPPMRTRRQGFGRNHSPLYRPAAFAVLGGDEEDQGRKEIQDSRDSAKKAVEEARTKQKQISFEENARKAEEKAKIKAVENQWVKWAWLGTGILVLAFVLRAWMRNRA